MRRRITWCVTGTLVLAASAIAAPVSASQAPAGPVQISTAQISTARIGTASVGEVLRPLLPRPAWARVARTTGGITGLVRGVTGAPYPGVCVTATGPANADGTAIHLAVSHPDGRYLLAHLRPGRYVLTVANCAGRRGSSPPLSVAWPGRPAVVTVLAGGLETLSPAIAWPTDQFGGTTGRSPTTVAAARGSGSISGRVTGNGRPLAHICAVAVRLTYPENGPEPHATTSRPAGTGSAASSPAGT